MHQYKRLKANSCKNDCVNAKIKFVRIFKIRKFCDEIRIVDICLKPIFLYINGLSTEEVRSLLG